MPEEQRESDTGTPKRALLKAFFSVPFVLEDAIPKSKKNKKKQRHRGMSVSL